MNNASLTIDYILLANEQIQSTSDTTLMYICKSKHKIFLLIHL